MDARALPPHPSLEQYRKQAKDLLRASRAGDPTAVERVGRCPRVRDRARGGRHVAYALADAQLVIAREHGFESWRTFASLVDALARRHDPVARFEAAADAVAAGDEATLRRLLRDHPALARARSTRSHHATLLHYVSANGVEDYRQHTPDNAVAIARALLEAGADVDAAADTYDGGTHQTTLNLLVSSVHPARAGLQPALVDVLVDHGARVDGPEGDGSPLLTALAFRYPDAAETLVRRGAAVRGIFSAAGLGREDLVAQLVGADGVLKREAPLESVPWLHVPRTRSAHVEQALIWAAAMGRVGVVELLASRRVDLSARDNQRLTALHWAVLQAHEAVVDALLRHHAPLELKNVYGGTVLDTAVWASVHVDGVFHPGGFARVDRVPIIERLLAAGARVDAVALPCGIARVDDLLARHGARPSPAASRTQTRSAD